MATIDNVSGGRTVGGRNRRPSAIVKMNGNPSSIARRKRQNKEKGTPIEDLVPRIDASKAFPAPMIKLPKRANEYYKSITEAMAMIGLITVLDHAILTRYVFIWDQWCREAEDQQKLRRRRPKTMEDVMMVTNQISSCTKNMMAFEAQLQSMEKQLGLTPAARATIAVRLKSLQTADDDVDPDDAFLDGCV